MEIYYGGQPVYRRQLIMVMKVKSLIVCDMIKSICLTFSFCSLFLIIETFTLQERIETLEEENRQALQKQKNLEQSVQSAETQSTQLAGVEAQLREKQEQCNKLRIDINSEY